MALGWCRLLQLQLSMSVCAGLPQLEAKRSRLTTRQSAPGRTPGKRGPVLSSSTLSSCSQVNSVVKTSNFLSVVDLSCFILFIIFQIV